MNLQHLFDSLSRMKWLEWICCVLIEWFLHYLFGCLEKWRKRKRKETNLQFFSKWWLFILGIHTYLYIKAFVFLFFSPMNVLDLIFGKCCFRLCIYVVHQSGLYNVSWLNEGTCLMKCLKEILYHGIWWLQVIYRVLEHDDQCVWTEQQDGILILCLAHMIEAL